MARSKKYPEFRKQLTPGWWLSNRHYTAYMLRELTSLFIAIFSLLYIYQIALLRTSQSSYSQYLNTLQNPVMVSFSIILLAFTLYHSFTWFYLTGKVMPVKMGSRTTTPLQAVVVNTVLMVVISFVVIKLFLP